MDLFALLAGFGGGVFAASIGALPAFILTGLFAVCGAVANLAGVDAGGFLTGTMAFGPFFGPWVSFAGGVAAAAYAKKKGLSENGADIATACASYQKADVLLVGGVFGLIGQAVHMFVFVPFLSGAISPKFATDPGIIVFFSGVLARLVFGGKLKTSDKILSSGDALTTTLTIGVFYSLLVAAVFCSVVPAAEAGGWYDALAGNYHVLVFGMAGVGLVFAEMGVAFTGCHHIVIIAAEATVGAYRTTGNLWIALVVGTVFGTISAILGDIEGNTINCGTDSHIDNPAFAIFIMTFVVSACFN